MIGNEAIRDGLPADRSSDPAIGTTVAAATTLRAADGVPLRALHWRAAEPAGVVVILHGYAEHVGRYGHVADFLNRRSHAVVGADFRGHGRSGPCNESGDPIARGMVRRFADYHADVDAVLEWAGALYPGLPCYLLAHSMGGLIALDWLLAQPNAVPFRACALSSPFLGSDDLRSPWRRVLVRWGGTLAGGVRVRLPFTGADLTHDTERAQDYDTDRLVQQFGGRASLRWLREVVCAWERVLGRASEVPAPALVMYGTADRVARPETTENFAGELPGCCRREACVGYYHELLNEPEPMRVRVMEMIAAWFEAHGTGASDSTAAPAYGSAPFDLKSS